jgi:DNA-binding transcriptional ArsR family regulator
MPKVGEAQVIKALADVNRLQILNSLAEKPKYISVLAKELRLDRTTVAYHLALLQSADLLESHYEILEEPRSKGKAAHVYSVNVRKLREILSSPLLKIIQENLQ